GRQCASELDNIPVAVVPFVEEREILEDLVNWRHDATYIRLRRAMAKKFDRNTEAAKMPVNRASRPPGALRALPAAAEAALARATWGPCRPGLEYRRIRIWPFRLIQISRGAW